MLPPLVVKAGLTGAQFLLVWCALQRSAACVSSSRPIFMDWDPFLLVTVLLSLVSPSKGDAAKDQLSASLFCCLLDAGSGEGILGIVLLTSGLHAFGYIIGLRGVI